LGEPILQIKVQVKSFEENLDSKDPIKLRQAQLTLNLGIKRRQVLDWMSDTEKLLYLKNHKENKRHILKGTGDWLLPDDIYNRGKNTTSSSPLFLHDILRSGKTRLTWVCFQPSEPICGLTIGFAVLLSLKMVSKLPSKALHFPQHSSTALEIPQNQYFLIQNPYLLVSLDNLLTYLHPQLSFLLWLGID
jgi:hypothetical protein